MFNKDFYPTPQNVIEMMVMGIDLANKTVLEPSAGKGNIVDYCKKNCANVIACEIDKELRKFLSGKCELIADDFLNVRKEDVSHVDFIIMNPPFSSQEKHILHAWDIAPSGCEIISLCNSSLISNRFKASRDAIFTLVEQHGRYENFGDCFSDAERKTGINISCLHLYKEGTKDEEFDGYFDLTDDDQIQTNNPGIVQYDFVRDIVSRYIEAVKAFDEVNRISCKINSLTKAVNPNFQILFGAMLGTNRERINIDREIFKKELQKSAWKRLFDLMRMDKYVTSGVMSSINNYVEKQVHIPFTVKNIYKMVQIIVGTHGSRMDNVLVEAFETICSFSYENSTAGEGWRTNTDFTIHKKFILPSICESGIWQKDYVSLNYNSNNKRNIEDVVKALCYMTGTTYDDSYESTLDGFISDKRMNWGQWYEWGFFRIKGFKKGTMHFEFLDEDVWREFNIRVAKIKGWNNMITHTKKGRARKNA